MTTTDGEAPRGAASGETAANDNARDPAVARAIEAARRDPSRRWTVAALAKIAGLSRAAFAARFRADTGATPLAYVTRLRVDLAASRLVEGSEPLAVVARAVGYASEFAFAKVFKRVVGVPPGAFRRSRAAPRATRAAA